MMKRILYVSSERQEWFEDQSCDVHQSLTTAMMTNGISVEEYILSQPPENRRELTLAASECLKRKYPMNSCELFSMARELRYRCEYDIIHP